jgi:putative transposase
LKIRKAERGWRYAVNILVKYGATEPPPATLESFNGSFRDECLSLNWFLSLEDAREKIQVFKEEYNDFRPHSAIARLTPNKVVQQHSLTISPYKDSGSPTGPLCLPSA